MEQDDDEGVFEIAGSGFLYGENGLRAAILGVVFPVGIGVPMQTRDRGISATDGFIPFFVGKGREKMKCIR